MKQAKRKSASSIFSKWNYSAYKCALESEKMTKILVRFYNTIVLTGYYLKRWTKLLAVTLEEGKWLILCKLPTKQLIEVDLQLLMRMFVGGRTESAIEIAQRTSKFNYGSRANYSIENAILENPINVWLSNKILKINDAWCFRFRSMLRSSVTKHRMHGRRISRSWTRASKIIC